MDDGHPLVELLPLHRLFVARPVAVVGAVVLRIVHATVVVRIEVSPVRVDDPDDGVDDTDSDRQQVKGVLSVEVLPDVIVLGVGEQRSELLLQHVGLRANDRKRRDVDEEGERLCSEVVIERVIRRHDLRQDRDDVAEEKDRRGLRVVLPSPRLEQSVDCVGE